VGAGEKGSEEKSVRAPADLLEEVFDLNMQLEEMRMARELGETDQALETSLLEAKRKFEGLLAAVDSVMLPSVPMIAEPAFSAEIAS